MSVKDKRKEVLKLAPVYKMIRDVLDGPAAVKAAGVEYLPVPDPTDKSPYANERYASYVLRAIFFDATSRTHEGFIGQMFYRETQIELPSVLKIMLLDVDGQSTGLEQQIKNTAGEVLAMGRAGLYTDYTAQPGQRVTREDQSLNRVRPTITAYTAERIINWRWSTVDNQKFLSLLVLEETYTKEDDGFDAKEDTQYRELRMVRSGEDGTGPFIFQSTVWRDDPDTGEFKAMEPTYPTKGNGKNWDRIPFEFIGSSDNDSEIDKPPLEGMAHVNIGHYRNSAEYEETIFMMGQPTPWASGITENWLAEAWKGELRLGTREFIPLPSGGQMGLLQMQPNTMAENGMKQKADMLVALGAKLAENKSVASTATEENRDSVIENSTLSSVAKNTSAAYTRAIESALIYANGSGKVVVEINTDFELSRMSPQDRQQLLAEWQGGGITWTEYRWNMKRGGVAYQDDAQAKAEIDAEMEQDIKLNSMANPQIDPKTGLPVEPVAEE
ncbi:putative structural protein [Pseudomonas phage Almagne]|nr:putative structural protein [Pseudomonas phage Almagne]